MNRLWARVRKLLQPPDPSRRDWGQVQPTGGREAREKAERDLERIKSETPKYARMGRESKQMRVENHIGPDIAVALMPRGRGHA